LISERLISAQKDLEENVAASSMRLSSFIVLHPSLFSFSVVTLFYRSYECHFASTFVRVWCSDTAVSAERLEHTDVGAASFFFSANGFLRQRDNYVFGFLQALIRAAGFSLALRCAKTLILHPDPFRLRFRLISL
jgi:hypothetical protein